MKNRRRQLAMFLSLLMITTIFSGCGETSDDGSKDNIALVEPVGVAADYAYAMERNMYFTDVFSSSVNPAVVEYSFPREESFKKYGKTPGETVSNGDILVYTETKNLDKQISDLQEEIADMESNQAIVVDGLNKDIEDAKKAQYEAFEPYGELLKFEPDEGTPEFEWWAQMALMPEGIYRRAVQNTERLEQSLKQTNELYELEHNYKLANLSRLQDKINTATLISNVNGEIVASGYYYHGDTIQKDTSVIAVGDTSKRVLQTEYISKANIKKALDIYAVIDGKRYEVEYVNMEPEEYKQRSEEGESVFTAFNLIDPTGEIQIGTYAVIVMVKDVRRDVLCVPNDSVKKEADGYYVYLYDGEETTYIPVEIGLKDALYTEILSGLKPGDKVLSTQVPKVGRNTATVTRGDYTLETELNGFLYYPFSEWITNPVQYGSTYIKEMLVSANEKVAKGQTLCTLEVIPDQIEIDRLSRQIARTQSRLTRLREKKAKVDARHEIDRGLEKQIAQYERDINLTNRSLQKISKYSGIVEIKAEYDGIVMDVQGLKPGSLLYPDSYLVEMANDSLSYVLVRDDKNQLNYGNEADIKVTSTNGASVIKGKVVNVNKICLSKALSSDFSIIAVPQEEIASIAGTTLVNGGRWDRNSFKVTVKVRSEKNVLMVPKAAVITKDKNAYVNVLKEDGSLEQLSFVPGGSDNNNYWVVDGLTEGMTVCWE